MNNNVVNNDKKNVKLKINAFIMPEYYYFSNSLLQIINYR